MTTDGSEAHMKESWLLRLAYRLRIKRRALSSFELITDSEFEQGLQRMGIAAGREATPTPVLEKVDLLVLRRPSN